VSTSSSGAAGRGDCLRINNSSSSAQVERIDALMKLKRSSEITPSAFDFSLESQWP
jgi:hypothetical protein